MLQRTDWNIQLWWQTPLSATAIFPMQGDTWITALDVMQNLKESSLTTLGLGVYVLTKPFNKPVSCNLKPWALVLMLSTAFQTWRVCRLLQLKEWCKVWHGTTNACWTLCIGAVGVVYNQNSPYLIHGKVHLCHIWYKVIQIQYMPKLLWNSSNIKNNVWYLPHRAPRKGDI